MQNPENARRLIALDRTQIDRTIRMFWHERLANAERAIRKYCADDMEFKFPGGIAFRGIDAVVEAVKRIDTNLEFLSFEILDLIVDGNQVALRWLAGVRNRGTGAEGELAVLDLITMRDGKLVGYEEYLDTLGFNDLMAGEGQHNLARLSNRKLLIQKSAPRQEHSDLEAIDVEEHARKVQYLRDFWEARGRTGGAACHDFFTPDVELQLIGDPVAIPFARTHVGVEATAKLVDMIDVEFETVLFEIHTILIDGDRAALQWSADVRHRGTNAPGYIQGFDHMLFENGRVKLFSEFYDTAQVKRCMTG